ncbi:MAG: antibiotic biosynthesis monooxygenase [Sneathiella sp.]|uniref:putative quinol monooxygenase n=1 Tax=Sneathiella sp. TaxID=1964365 RepID=UPI00300310DF
MTDHVYWILELDVNEGQMANMKALMADMVAATSQDEPGALDYQWSLTADEKTCHIFERYKNSAATLVHMGNFGSKFAGTFMKVFTPKKFTLYGSPTPDVMAALGPMGPVEMSSIGGFTR